VLARHLFKSLLIIALFVIVGYTVSGVAETVAITHQFNSAQSWFTLLGILINITIAANAPILYLNRYEWNILVDIMSSQIQQRVPTPLPGANHQSFGACSHYKERNREWKGERSESGLPAGGC